MNRGTSNSNSRGSSYDRKARKEYVLSAFGDGNTAKCSFDCGTTLDFSSVTIDRFPVAGVDGGKYTRNNIRPACSECNSRHGSLLMWSRKDKNVKH